VVTVPAAQKATSATPLVITGVSIADADANVAGQTITATLTDTVGALSVGNSGGGTVTGSGSASVSIVGTLAQVNADLATLSYLSGTVGSDSIKLAANDGDGGTGSKSIAVTTAAAPSGSQPGGVLASPSLFSQSVSSLVDDETGASFTAPPPPQTTVPTNLLVHG
jgi:hypothetical protein